jgi:hypothetical protein
VRWQPEKAGDPVDDERNDRWPSDVKVKWRSPVRTIHSFAFSVVAALLFALPGCQRQEGPAERAGREVDKAVEKTGQQMEKAGERIEDAAKDARK